MLAYIFLALSVILAIFYFVTRKQTIPKERVVEEKGKEEKPEKINYGPLRIFFGSQTGTAAKLSEQLTEEATDQGFEAEVIDLKDVKISHFEGHSQISIFLLSNTGEGDPPQNCIRWMKVLKRKQSLDEVKEVNWKNVNFSVFGLGNTQYQHYNVTGIETDRLLQQLGAYRIHQLGLGDDNCSLEDDFAQWKKELWPSLKQFRKSHPLTETELHQHHTLHKISSEDHHDLKNLSKRDPFIANYRICFQKPNHEPDHVNQQDLDFKTKHSIKAEKCEVRNIRQLRQNEKDGSTLQLQIELKEQPEYDTAGNIALYGKNDPKIIKEIIDYFQIKETDLDKKIGVTVINEDKKIKLNFIPNTLRTLLQNSIDIQGRLTKSVLKKLSKLKSNNPKYFSDNCSPKTTEEYKRITEKNEPEHWYYLIKIIKEYKVELTFEDFIELSDSMAPRIFTMASHYHTQKNVIVAASLTENGLISKCFQSRPKAMMAQLRKSTFTDAMKWKKVIFIAAGTGLAPFRAYIQEKVYNINQKKEGKNVNVPIITLFFGCKHETGDFIYKDEILNWRDQGIIDRLHLAFSRDTEKKVYVQNLLEKEQNELKELGHCKDTAIYLCGSLPMGNSIIEVLTKAFGADKVKEMETEGRIIKELW